jgi:hypothetical protein
MHNPYKNEHSLSITDSSQYFTIRRKNNEFGKGIHVIYGIWRYKKGSEVQALRFSKDYFTLNQAKQWAKEHNFKGTWSKTTMPNPIEIKLDVIDKIEQQIAVDIKHYVEKYVFTVIKNMNLTDDQKAVIYEEVKDDIDIYIIKGINNLLDQIGERASKHKLRGY